MPVNLQTIPLSLFKDLHVQSRNFLNSFKGRPDTMTLEEFLENDLEGYEYVKGELIPTPPERR